MDIDDVFKYLVVLLLILLIAGGITLTLAPKNIDYYYISHSGNSNVSTCVWAHWTWHTDEQVFCTDDINKATDTALKMNADLHKK